MIVTDKFVDRHNGPRENDVKLMLSKIGAKSVDELIDQTIPAAIRLKKPLDLSAGMTEYNYHKHLRAIASKNKIFKTYIGLGYSNTIIPPVVQRNVLENPSPWFGNSKALPIVLVQFQLDKVCRLYTNLDFLIHFFEQQEE